MRHVQQRIKSILRLFAGGLLVGGMLPLHALSLNNDSLHTSAATDTAKIQYIYLLHADSMVFNNKVNADAQIFVGHVAFRHDSLYMYCDSALLYSTTNSLDAYGNVSMNQGDTLFLYGDRLLYSGDEMLAKVRDNVRMVDTKMTLLTDSLNFDRTINLGYYFNGGTLQDSLNVLTSDWGEYDTKSKMAVFNYEVKLTNSDYVLTSDTLRYSTQTRVATIVGPSEIVSDNNQIVSTLGFYDTNKNQAELLDRSVLKSKGKEIVGDSLFYDRQKGYGEAFRRVVMDDFENKNRLTGNYVYYNELNDSAVATDQAVVTDYSQGDSMFIHADTLRLVSFYMDTDSVYRIVKGFRKVRLFKSDVQAVCDSMVFNTQDSCLTLYYDPIIWSGPQQILGEQIKIYMNDSTIEWAHIINQALMVEQLDSVHYNQIGGREIKAFFAGGEIKKTDVIGNVQVIYYYQEEGDSALFGMNSTEASFLSAEMRQRQVHKITIVSKSNGVFYPITQIPPEKLKLSNFAWFEKIRPRNKYDILYWRGKSDEEKLRVVNRRNVPLPTLN